MPAASNCNSAQGQMSLKSSEFKDLSSENMDNLVKEIAENLKLAEAAASAVADAHRAASGGHAGPLVGAIGGHYGSDHHDLDPYGGSKVQSNPVNSFKLKNSFGRRGHHHRSSPYAVPPSSRACDTGNLGSSPTARGPSQLRKWNHQRRRYPSTCMNSQANNGENGVVNVKNSNSGGGGKAGVNEDPEDPFQMLQELIDDGSLIKEAVRRLQKGLYPTTPGITPPTPGGNPHNANNKTFYDSEDDEFVSRTPPNLCCEVGL